NELINPNEPLLDGTFENRASFTRAILSWHRTRDKFENRLVAAFGTEGFRFDIGGIDPADDLFVDLTTLSVQLREDATWTLSDRLALRGGGEAVFNWADRHSRFTLPPQQGLGENGNFSTQPKIETD